MQNKDSKKGSVKTEHSAGTLEVPHKGWFPETHPFAIIYIVYIVYIPMCKLHFSFAFFSWVFYTFTIENGILLNYIF